jgi:hypothetical protein
MDSQGDQRAQKLPVEARHCRRGVAGKVNNYKTKEMQK